MPIEPESFQAAPVSTAFGAERVAGAIQGRVHVRDVGTTVEVFDLAALRLTGRFLRLHVTAPGGGSATVVGWFLREPASPAVNPDLAARTGATQCARLRDGERSDRFFVDMTHTELAVIADAAGAIVELVDAQV